MCLSTFKENRICIVCESKVYGKQGKIFCNLKCKNYYNNYKRSVLHKMHHDANNMIYKNYLILAGFLQEENDEVICNQIDMERLGFQFEKLTGVVLKNKMIYFQVYEYTFSKMKDNKVSIRRNQTLNKLPSLIYKRGQKELENKMIQSMNN